MKTISKYTLTERIKYSYPAKYKKTTWYAIKHESGESQDFMCGGRFKSFRTFEKAMRKKYPNQIA